MPDQDPIRTKYSRKFRNDAGIVSGVGKKAKRCEEIEYGVELSAPPRRQLSHVAARIAKVWTSPTLACYPKQIFRVIQAVDLEARFGQKMRVSPLSAGNVENLRPRRQLEYVDESRDFLAITLECEDRLVLEQVVGVEVPLPPLVLFFQKKTGSRYAPNTSSIARRISYSVQ